MPFVALPTDEQESKTLDVCRRLFTVVSETRDRSIFANACLRTGMAILALGGATEEQVRQVLDSMLKTFPFQRSN